MGGSERRLQSWRGGRAEKAKCEKSGTWMKSKSEIIPCSPLHHLNDRISLSLCAGCVRQNGRHQLAGKLEQLEDQSGIIAVLLLRSWKDERETYILWVNTNITNASI